MTDVGQDGAGRRALGPGRRTLVHLLAGAWLVLWPALVLHAVASPWAPMGQAPTAAQIAAAHERVWVSAVVGGGLAVVVCALAARARMSTTATLAGTAVPLVGLVTAVLLGLSSG